MDIETPKGWRKGQTIFNFLEWIKKVRDYGTITGASGGNANPFESRMADPFHINDMELDKLFKEFLNLHER